MAPASGNDNGPRTSTMASTMNFSTYSLSALGHAPESPLFASPRMRHSSKEAPCEQDPLRGHVTAQEALWGVIITMGIAGMRDDILVNNNVECYVLHFFCFWGPVSASTNYSARFNDADSFHKLLWTCVTLGMAGQVAYLYHDLRGFASATAWLYAVIALAYIRVFVFLPRSRSYCMFFAIGNLLAMSMFVVIAIRGDAKGWSDETVFLRIHIFLEPILGLLIRLPSALTHILSLGQYSGAFGMNVEVNAEYLVNRYQGLHMMMLVCSVLFPLGLSGARFCSSRESGLIISLAIFYAVLLKLSLLDTHMNYEAASERHALRRSEWTAFVFVGIVPLSLLGIALTGVGFVAAANGASVVFARALVCYGPALTWAMLTLSKALNRPRKPIQYAVKIVLFMIASGAFIIPEIAQLSTLVSVAWVVTVMFFVLVLQVVLQATNLGTIPVHWRWKDPRLLLQWDQMDNFQPIGARVSSQEHFFTVLVAVCVLKLNLDLRAGKDLMEYVFQFMLFYGVLWASMRHAARFNDEDLAHKILWALFAFGLFLMLEGLAENKCGSDGVTLLHFATIGVYLLLGLGFAGRVAFQIPSVRIAVGCIIWVNLLCAAFIFLASLDTSSANIFFFFYFCLSVLADPMFSLLGSFNREIWETPLNVEYIVARFNGLYMEILGVAVIVPNCIYPGDFAHPLHVFIGDAIAVLLAVVIKMGLYDVEPVSFERHAVRQSKLAQVLFLSVHAPILFSLSLVGAGMPMLIESSGRHGLLGETWYPKCITCSALCLLWMSMTLTKLMHLPKKKPSIHRWKVVVQGVGAVANLLPLAYVNLGDFLTIVFALVINTSIVLLQTILNFL